MTRPPRAGNVAEHVGSPDPPFTGCGVVVRARAYRSQRASKQNMEFHEWRLEAATLRAESAGGGRLRRWAGRSNSYKPLKKYRRIWNNGLVLSWSLTNGSSISMNEFVVTLGCEPFLLWRNGNGHYGVTLGSHLRLWPFVPPSRDPSTKEGTCDLALVRLERVS